MRGLALATAFGLVLALSGTYVAVRRCRKARLGGWAYVFGLTALWAFFAWVGLLAVGDLLASMHRSGVADRGLGFLVGVRAPTTTSDVVADAIGRWATWYRDSAARSVARPSVVFWAHLLIDSALFVPGYVALLWMIRWRARGIADDLEPWRGLWKERGALWLPAAVAIADLTENVLLAVYVVEPLRTLESDANATPQLDDGGLLALRITTGVKWVLAMMLLVSVIPPLVRWWSLPSARGSRRSVREAVFRVRALVVLTAVFGIMAIIRLQVPDVILRWTPVQGILAVVGAIAFGLVSWIWGRRILEAERDPARQPGPIALAITAAVTVMVALVALAAWGATGMLVPAGTLVLLAVLQGRLPYQPVRDVAGAPATGRKAIPRLLAIAPPLLLSVGALRAFLPETIFHHPDDPSLVWLVMLLGFAVPVAGTLAFYRILSIPAVDEATIGRSWLAMAVRVSALAIATYVYLRVVSAVWSFTQGVGAVAVAAAFLAILAAAFGAASLWIERAPPPGILVSLGFKRTPVFAFLVVWLVVVGIVAERQDFHDVRTDLRVAEDVATIDAQQAFDRWAARNPGAPSPAEGERTPIPMVFIGANGGGIKAATWAALALDCVLLGGQGGRLEGTPALCGRITEPGIDRTGSVFVMSGVSGGTLGMVDFIAHELETGGVPDPGWIRRLLDEDFVSPTLAWQLFVEAPRALLQFRAGMDRAEVLERAWERGWLDRDVRARVAATLWGLDGGVESGLQAGFLSTMSEHGDDLPLLMFNSTTVEDGCRFIVSTLETDGTNVDGTKPERGGRNCTGIVRLSEGLPEGRLFAASRDVRHFLCPGHDVRLSTAAMIAARFPWVSPSGRMPYCAGDPGSVHVVDGGYLDNSGGASLAELWEVVQGDVAAFNTSSTTSCIVPYLILIDSGYGPTPDSPRDDVPELLVPIKGLFSARDSRTIEGRNDAALSFRRDIPGVAAGIDRVATLYLRIQPGGQAPLGWTLDDTSIDALEAQLATGDGNPDVDGNADEIDTIARWFSEDAATCS
jgi:hypothetical protein